MTDPQAFAPLFGCVGLLLIGAVGIGVWLRWIDEQRR